MTRRPRGELAMLLTHSSAPSFCYEETDDVIAIALERIRREALEASKSAERLAASLREVTADVADGT
jgi:hypothetical protein